MDTRANSALTDGFTFTVEWRDSLNTGDRSSVVFATIHKFMPEKGEAVAELIRPTASLHRGALAA